jgi:hypothetical protein
MKTISQGVDKGRNGEVIEIPAVPIREENICAYTAIHKKPLNIEDVYYSDEFDFSGPKNYDKMTGYRTQSMLTIPLIGLNDDVLGVLQLMNAKNKDGVVVPFDKSLEHIVFSLSSQASIAVCNMQYMDEIKDTLWSFTEAMTEAIDARTPYNASHTRNVGKYSVMIADYINELYEKGEETEYFSEDRKDQLRMGAMLHDIGKMIVPTKVMNKATRLGDEYDRVVERLNFYKAKYEIMFLREVLEIAVAREIIDLGNFDNLMTVKLIIAKQRHIIESDLTDEERERICNLEFSLKAPLNNDCEAVKRLNGECEYLIKKMTEYGVSV